MKEKDLPYANSIRLFVKPFFKFLVVATLLLSCFRLGFFIWQYPRIDSANMGIETLFVQGIRFDLLVISTYLLPILLVTFFFSISNRLMKYWRPVMAIYLITLFTLLAYMEVSTPSFINEYDARPNILFVEYLKYPKEVLSTLWGAYKIQLILLVIIIPSLVLLAIKLFANDIKRIPAMKMTQILWLAPMLTLLFLIMARSSFGHRPANPSSVALSSDGMVNELALNSLYSLTYAIYEASKEGNGGVRYGEMPFDKVISQVKNNMGADPAGYQFNNPNIPTLHQQNSFNTKQKNLVIVLEESLGAEFVGALGGLPLTPNIDELKSKGIWFNNLYATGTRSVRGIEAVLTGFTPTSARSTVKLGQTQRDFFTLAQLLSKQGYDTEFIYGGDSNFDNMRRFFMNNGFNSVIDEKDYEDYEFKGSWGVSDGDLFNKAHEQLMKDQDGPFFKMIFTTSNHSPFEYPEGKIERYDNEKQTVNNAVKYADYALGVFIRKARHSAYWDDTVFLIVADHNSRVYGETILPIERFHIPALILGKGIDSKIVNKVSSQIDLAPTLLPLIGLEASHPMIGRDMLADYSSELPGRAIMQFHSTQGYMQDNQVVVLRPNMKAETFDYDKKDLVKSKVQNSGLIEKALAISLWSSNAIKQKLYRLPGQ